MVSGIFNPPNLYLPLAFIELIGHKAFQESYTTQPILTNSFQTQKTTLCCFSLWIKNESKQRWHVHTVVSSLKTDLGGSAWVEHPNPENWSRPCTMTSSRHQRLTETCGVWVLWCHPSVIFSADQKDERQERVSRPQLAVCVCTMRLIPIKVHEKSKTFRWATSTQWCFKHFTSSDALVCLDIFDIILVGEISAWEWMRTGLRR